MPHAFRAHPGHQAIDHLVKLHADLGGRIQANKDEAVQLAEAMKHVEAVIKLYNPDYNVARIAGRRRQKTNPWFKRGTLFREALDVMRKAAGPLTCAEITDGVLAAHGIKDATKRQWQGIEAGIRSCLETAAGKTVERAGDGVPRRWKVRS
jgi:hypothetical protein